jgi:hypothetical protein
MPFANTAAPPNTFCVTNRAPNFGTQINDPFNGIVLPETKMTKVPHQMMLLPFVDPDSGGIAPEGEI